MAKTLTGRPAAGKLVRDPAHDFNPVPAADRTYPATDYWRRRFAQGDMIAAAPATAATEPEAPVEESGAPADETSPASSRRKPTPTA